MTDDGFVLVRTKRKRGRHRDAAYGDSQRTGNRLEVISSQITSFLPEKSEKKNIDEELLRLERCKREVQESGFYSKFLSDIDASLRDIDHCETVTVDMICYGLGLISSCPIARYQFSLLLLLTSYLRIDPKRCHLYDPVFSDTDRALVAQRGFSLIPCNEEGWRPVDSPTIFYMPHCGKLLYDNVLRANWSSDRLASVIIIGNRFSHYRERLLRSQLEREAPCIARVLGYTTQRELSSCFRHCDVFNDLAIHDFNVPVDVCKDFWNDVPEAVNDPHDSEIIRAERTA